MVKINQMKKKTRDSNRSIVALNVTIAVSKLLKMMH